MPEERRTAEGAILRSGLDAVAKEFPDIPAGKTRVVEVALYDGRVELGSAWLTKNGWTIETKVAAKVLKAKDIGIFIRLTK